MTKTLWTFHQEQGILNLPKIGAWLLPDIVVLHAFHVSRMKRQQSTQLRTKMLISLLIQECKIKILADRKSEIQVGIMHSVFHPDLLRLKVTFCSGGMVWPDHTSKWHDMWYWLYMHNSSLVINQREKTNNKRRNELVRLVRL